MNPRLFLSGLLLATLGLGGCAKPPYANLDNAQLKALRQQGVPIYDVRRPDTLARHLVEQMGYTQVYNVRRGITDWIGDKQPVVRN